MASTTAPVLAQGIPLETSAWRARSAAATADAVYGEMRAIKALTSTNTWQVGAARLQGGRRCVHAPNRVWGAQF